MKRTGIIIGGTDMAIGEKVYAWISWDESASTTNEIKEILDAFFKDCAQEKSTFANVEVKEMEEGAYGAGSPLLQSIFVPLATYEHIENRLIFLSTLLKEMNLKNVESGISCCENSLYLRARALADMKDGPGWSGEDWDEPQRLKR